MMQTDILGAYVSVATDSDRFRQRLVDRRMAASHLLRLPPQPERPSVSSAWSSSDVATMGISRNGSGAWRRIPKHAGTHGVRDWTPICRDRKGRLRHSRPECEAYLRSADFKVALTLIPYDGYRVEEAKRAAEQIGRPLIESNQSVFSSGNSII